MAKVALVVEEQDSAMTAGVCDPGRGADGPRTTLSLSSQTLPTLGTQQRKPTGASRPGTRLMGAGLRLGTVS